MSEKEKDPSSSDLSTPREEKTLYQTFQEMPYSNDRVGQSFVMFRGQGRIVSRDVTPGEDPAETRKRKERLEKLRARRDKRRAENPLTHIAKREREK